MEIHISPEKKEEMVLLAHSTLQLLLDWHDLA
jgi:hypothetical protein